MDKRIALALLMGLAASPCLAGSGFYNMPTTLPQCSGYGYGPGYHAPMVLKPYYRSWNAGKGIVRARPHQYPPIYQRHSGGAGFSQMSTLGATPASYAMPHRPAPTPVHYHRVPRASHPASPAGFAPPAMQRAPAPRPANPRPAVEQVPAEPASPSDALAPDELPLPPGA